MWTLLRRLLCHHDYGIASEPGRVFLRCRHCGHGTPGWTIDRADPLESQQSERGRVRRFPNAPIPPLTFPRGSGTN